jgi:adenosylcobinamide-GDP ribazoletransferase
MRLLDSVRLAVGTLTIVPAGAISRLDRRGAGRAMLLAPLAVLPVAILASGSGLLGHAIHLPPLLCGLLVVSALAVGTRAMHLDGLADTVDGLGSGRDRDKALAVMRRGNVGPMGVTALVLVLGAQTVAAAELCTGWRGAATLTALICLSRAALSIACRQGVRPARPEGLGQAVAGSVPQWAAGVTAILALALLAALASWRGQPWWVGVVGAVVTILVVTLLVSRCVRRFGGVTGDVLGASVEVALTVLVVLAVAG